MAVAALMSGVGGIAAGWLAAWRRHGGAWLSMSRLFAVNCQHGVAAGGGVILCSSIACGGGNGGQSAASMSAWLGAAGNANHG